MTDQTRDIVERLREPGFMPRYNRVAMCAEAADHIEALTKRVAELEEALTPSGATKHAYIGEFHFTIDEQDSEQMCEVSRKVTVPWTTIKEIMAAIRARAALSNAARGKEI
jgi:hypothetical protein